MDFVPNHTSDEHEWFIKSVRNESKYADYYVWSNGRKNDIDTYPPNNWVGLYFCTVHVVTFTLFKTNSCTY
jgi:glycosidase